MLEILSEQCCRAYGKKVFFQLVKHIPHNARFDACILPFEEIENAAFEERRAFLDLIGVFSVSTMVQRRYTRLLCCL